MMAMDTLLQGAFARKLLVVCGMLGFLVLAGGSFPAVSAELPPALTVQVDIEDGLPNVSWEQAHLELFLLDDSPDLSGRLATLQEESKVSLEPLIKDYMFKAEWLTRLANHQENAEERAEALLAFRERETQIQHVLDRYSAQIDRIFQEQTLQVRNAQGQAVKHIAFHEIPPGKYRVYAVLSFATTVLHWFEAFSIEGGGEGGFCVLTRENLNNPYWTDLNWWRFINLDFSKHH